MRRLSGGFEVVVKAPTLGLVTRIPGEQPDPRAATAAQNVRFEDGVAKNSEGYGALQTTPALDSPANLVFQVDTSGNVGQIGGGNFAVVGTSQKLYSLTRFPAGYTPVSFSVFAGDPQTVSGTGFALDGSVVGVTPTFVQWVLLSGPSGVTAAFDDAGSLTPNVTLSSAVNGDYTFRLYAGAGLQLKSSDVVVSVSGACTPPSFSQNILPTSIPVASSMSFSIIADGTDLVYEWQYSADSGATWTALVNGSFLTFGTVSGADTADLTLTSDPPDNPVFGWYFVRCLVSNGCGSATSNHALIIGLD